MEINFNLNHRPAPPKKLTKSFLREEIQKERLDEYTKTELLKKLEEFPGCSLGQFYKNIYNIIAEIRENRNQ